MKRTLRKKAAKKAVTHKIATHKIKHKHTEAELLLLFAAVLSLFFAVLSAQALSLFLNYGVAVQDKADEMNNSLNTVEMRLENDNVLNQLNSLNNPNATNH